MHPEECKPFRIGGLTLVNGSSYPSDNGDKLDRMLPLLQMTGAPSNPSILQGGPAATFGTATLQREYSFDRTTWVADGGAISAVTPTAVTMYRNLWYRWKVGGTGNITAAQFFIA